MCSFRELIFGISLLTTCLQTHGASKYTDENRPYEFGFNIDGEQHRHEKKDENGIIMGEFGFITADGVYHVTVYATDENGNFKILSMKNIRVKPYPTTSTSNVNVKQGHSLKLPPVPQGETQQSPPPPPQTQPKPQINIEPPAKSCSHCSIPTTSTPAPKLSDLAIVSQDQPSPFDNSNPQYNSPVQNNQQSQQEEQQYPGQQSYLQEPQQPYPEQPPSQTQPGIDGNQFAQQGGIDTPIEPENYYGQQDVSKGDRNPKQYDQSNYLNPQQQFDYPPNQQPNDPNDVSAFTRIGGPDQDQGNPALISAHMQIVDKNTDIHHIGPGEREGLPPGIEKEHVTTLLYTFNYTVGFHGHHEEGYTDGVKKGYYFITGRNGVRTRVDYVADGTGFHPKISQEVLDLLSEDVPKPETEKDEKYGLKGYEFKWLYFPENSRR